MMLLALLDHLRDKQRRKLWTADQATGRRGEDLAHRYLRGQGYVVVARNYRLPAGDAEADIIAWDGEELVIVEVKTRESDAFGPPDRAIGEDKQRALQRVAREYGRKGNVPEAQVRCDVVSVILGPPTRIELFRNAVRLLASA
jgi:putative endonuclease